MNKINNIIVLVVFILGGGSTLWGQEVLTLEKCRENALTYNKSLKKAGFQLEEANAQKKSAFTNYLPKVEATGTAMMLPTMDDIQTPELELPTGESAQAIADGNATGIAFMPGVTFDTENLSILMAQATLQQPIYTGGKIKTANKMAAQGVEMAKQAFQLKEADVMLKTDEAYWGLAAMQEKVELATKYVEMLSLLEMQMTDAYELGLAPKSEKLKVTVQKNNAQLGLLQAKNGSRLMQMNLCRIIGLPLNTAVQLQDSIFMRGVVECDANSVEAAMKSRQELQILEGQVELNRLNKKMVTADFMPQLGAQVGYMYTKLNSIYDGGNLSVTASLSVPVFHWGERQHKRRVAQMQTNQAEVTLDETREFIEMEVQQVLIQLQEAEESLVWAQNNKLAAEESLEESKISFDVGLNTTTELLNAQAAWQKAYSEEINVLANYEVLKTKYLKVIGVLANEVDS